MLVMNETDLRALKHQPAAPPEWHSFRALARADALNPPTGAAGPPTAPLDATGELPTYPENIEQARAS
jgi:hypothetical protein